MDDTSSQWSAAADTEEERKSALEKSMYVFQTSLNLCPMAIRAVVHSLNKCVVSNSNILESVSTCSSAYSRDAAECVSLHVELMVELNDNFTYFEDFPEIAV